MELDQSFKIKAEIGRKTKPRVSEYIEESPRRRGKLKRKLRRNNQS